MSKFRNVTVLSVIAVAVVLSVFGVLYLQARSELPPHVDFLTSMKTALHVPTKLADGLADKNEDLTADAPEDAAEIVDPETLVFEVLGVDLAREQEQWADFIPHFEKATGKKVTLTVRSQEGSSLGAPTPPVLQQARDFRDGKIHVACLNTGAVTLAVNVGGAVPFCVMADEDGKFGYEMEIIVPVKSAVKDPSGLKGSQKILFASAYSHSGFKAPLMILSKEFGLQPERDYTPVFVAGQEQAIKEIAAGRGDAAPVASDFLQRKIDLGEIAKDSVRAIYHSKSFPPACFAHAHQLNAELVQKVKAAFLEFDCKGTSLEKGYSAANQSRFVPATYKEDWTSVREVEEQVAGLLPAKAP